MEGHYTQKKTKRFDFSTGDNELLEMNLGDHQYMRLLGDEDDEYVVDIRKKTRGKYHVNGIKVPAKIFKLAAKKLLEELEDLDPMSLAQSMNRLIENNLNIKRPKPMPQDFKPKGNESVIFYAK